MKICVTGASGLVGSNLVIELLKNGFNVRATKRTTSKISHLKPFEIEWMDADLDDVEALTRAFTGCDVIIHCAAMVSMWPKMDNVMEKVNVRGTKNVLKAFCYSHAKRLIHCSSVSALGNAVNGNPATEETPFGNSGNVHHFGYPKTKFKSQQLVIDAAKEGIDAVIINPTYMVGPYDSKPSSGAIIVEVLKRRVPFYTSGGNNFVDVRDVCRGMIASIEKGTSGRMYILGGENLSYKEFFMRIGKIGNVKPPSINIPKPLALLGGKFGDLKGLIKNKDPQINSVTVTFGFQNAHYDCQRAKDELGYSYGPLDIGLNDAISWFRENGYSH